MEERSTGSQQRMTTSHHIRSEHHHGSNSARNATRSAQYDYRHKDRSNNDVSRKIKSQRRDYSKRETSNTEMRSPFHSHGDRQETDPKVLRHVYRSKHKNGGRYYRSRKSHSSRSRSTSPKGM